MLADEKIGRPRRAPVSDAVRSLEWSAAIERATSSLPRRRWPTRYRGREFRHDSRIAFASTLDLTAPFTASGIFVHHATGDSLLTGASRVRSRATADIVAAGIMRTARQLRFRAFYVVDDRPRTVAAQQRLEPGVPTRLVAGSRVQATLSGRLPFAVPRVLAAGLIGNARRGRVDWVVEEALDGALIPAAEADATVEELVELLAHMWLRLGVTHAPLDAGQHARILRAFERLTHDPLPGVWPRELDRDTTWRRVRELVTEARPLTTAVCHGDPGLGNVLRLADGRLALVDWETAGHRPVAYDVVKALLSAPDPAALAAGAAGLAAPAALRPAIAAGAAPWRRQLAVSLALFMSGWRSRHRQAIRRGSKRAGVRRMHHQLRMLTALLD